MQIRKKWLNPLKNFFNKHFKEYYLASSCWWIPSSCENRCNLLNSHKPVFDQVLESNSSASLQSDVRTIIVFCVRWVQARGELCVASPLPPSARHLWHRLRHQAVVAHSPHLTVRCSGSRNCRQVYASLKITSFASHLSPFFRSVWRSLQTHGRYLLQLFF